MNAILLAGGKSRRFGKNKALIRVNQHTLIENIIRRLKTVFQEVYVIGNQETDYTFLEGVNVLKDLLPERGPLGGLYTGLEYSSGVYNFVTACDMPFLTEDFLNYLVGCRRDYEVLIPEYRGYLEPLAGVYSRNCLPAVKDCLKAGHLKIKTFFPEVKLKIIREEIIRELGEPANLFYNINCRKDLRTITEFLEA